MALNVGQLRPLPPLLVQEFVNSSGCFHGLLAAGLWLSGGGEEIPTAMTVVADNKKRVTLSLVNPGDRFDVRVSPEGKFILTRRSPVVNRQHTHNRFRPAATKRSACTATASCTASP